MYTLPQLPPTLRAIGQHIVINVFVTELYMKAWGHKTPTKYSKTSIIETIFHISLKNVTAFHMVNNFKYVL